MNELTEHASYSLWWLSHWGYPSPNTPADPPQAWNCPSTFRSASCTSATVFTIAPISDWSPESESRRWCMSNSSAPSFGWESSWNCARHRPSCYSCQAHLSWVIGVLCWEWRLGRMDYFLQYSCHNRLSIAQLEFWYSFLVFFPDRSYTSGQLHSSFHWRHLTCVEGTAELRTEKFWPCSFCPTTHSYGATLEILCKSTRVSE